MTVVNLSMSLISIRIVVITYNPIIGYFSMGLVQQYVATTVSKLGYFSSINVHFLGFKPQFNIMLLMVTWQIKINGLINYNLIIGSVLQDIYF